MEFIFKKKVDEKCWHEYMEFIKQNGSVWGIKSLNQTVSKEIIDLAIASYSKIWTHEIHQQICHFFADIFKFRISPEKFKFFITTIPFSTYSEHNGWIAIAARTKDPKSTICHEINHRFFYESIGHKLPFEEYYEIKEYLTVLNNDLVGLNIFDTGYPQHKKIRAQIYAVWKKTKSIDECLKLAQSAFGIQKIV